MSEPQQNHLKKILMIGGERDLKREENKSDKKKLREQNELKRKRTKNRVGSFLDYVESTWRKIALIGRKENR